MHDYIRFAGKPVCCMNLAGLLEWEMAESVNLSGGCRTVR